jgi:2-polyprenyl-3-methyl-5-hydroxy-6-metoxy-1,4-benzoquinol methylase
MALHRFLKPTGPIRLREPELMDSPDLDRTWHHEALDGLRRINSWSLTARQFAAPLAGWAAPGDRLRVLDLACGGGDVVLALETRARRSGLRLLIDGCDISERAIEYARKRARRSGSRARFFPCDVLKGPLPKEYDVLISSLFLHHLVEGDALALIRRMAGACRLGLLVSDLERRPAGYWLAVVAPRFLSRSVVVHTDSVRSVRASFTLDELDGLLRQAGLNDYKVARRWPCRMLLSWRKHL